MHPEGHSPSLCLLQRGAIRLAFLKIAQNEVTSTWMDAWETDIDLEKYIEVPGEAVFKDHQEVLIVGNEEKVLQQDLVRGERKGGMLAELAVEHSWTDYKLVGGVGLRWARCHPTALQPGDVVDFWRVLKADKKRKASYPLRRDERPWRSMA